MNRELVLSFLRVFAAAALACFLNLGVAPLDLSLGDLKALVNAGLAAVILTVFNYLRPGEDRFGVGEVAPE